MELSRYFQSQTLPVTMVEEAKQFCNDLYRNFKQYNPRFVIFFDNGTCLQNSAVQKQYKQGRSSSSYILDDKERDLFYQIKNYYLEQIETKFHKPPVGFVFNLKEYESDLVPYYVIFNRLLNSNDRKTLNIILSTDKDLLQCCKFRNTVQCITTYSPKEGKLLFNIYYYENAISYFYKKFKVGLGITADFVSLLLAIAGDKADYISGIKNVGYARAYKLILKYGLPPVITGSTELPDELEPHRKLIISNLKVIDFEQQITRLPATIDSYFATRIANQRQENILDDL